MNARGAKLTCSVAALLIGQSALACAVVVPDGYWGSAKQRRAVQSAVERAPLIVDGEVIQPFVRNKQNAVVRVHRVLKGNAQDTIEVGEADSCSIRLDVVGERSRMILSEGPNVYQLYRDQSEARLEDRILKSDRRKAWPYVAGRKPN